MYLLLRRALLSASVVSATLAVTFSSVYAHRDGCHRWHTCPSDTGSYTMSGSGSAPSSNYAAPPPTVTPTPVPRPPTITPTPVTVTSFAASAGAYSGAGAAIKDANLRGGPGTNYPVIGLARKGQVFVIISVNIQRTWYQVDSGAWIAASLIDAAQRPLQPLSPQPQADNGLGSKLSIVTVQSDESASVVGIRNNSGEVIDISGWYLFGSASYSCAMPTNTVLQPGQTFLVAAGAAAVGEPGYKCSDTPLARKGESVYLQSIDGRQLAAVL